MSQHTPGPWTIEPGHDGIEYIVKIGGDRFSAYLGSSGAPKEEWNANARLIAAAPELLALVEEVLRGGNKTTQALRKMVGETWLRDARAAIAKAKA